MIYTNCSFPNRIKIEIIIIKKRGWFCYYYKSLAYRHRPILPPITLSILAGIVFRILEFLWVFAMMIRLRLVLSYLPHRPLIRLFHLDCFGHFCYYKLSNSTSKQPHILFRRYEGVAVVGLLMGVVMQLVGEVYLNHIVDLLDFGLFLVIDCLGLTVLLLGGFVADFWFGMQVVG